MASCVIDVLLTWTKSPILCFELNAKFEEVTYSVTRHTVDGRTQRSYLAFVDHLRLGRFVDGGPGLLAAQGVCEAHANTNKLCTFSCPG
jgi:hypothetical protein